MPINKIIVLGLSLFFLIAHNIKADQYQCVSAEIAEKAKALIEKKKFIIEFCSNCSAEISNIKRINIQKVSVKQAVCGYEVFVEGKIVRGIKPPVFGGDCAEQLEVSNPSQALKLPFSEKLDLAYEYIWDEKSKQFITIAEALGLDTKNICIKHLMLKR